MCTWKLLPFGKYQNTDVIKQRCIHKQIYVKYVILEEHTVEEVQLNVMKNIGSKAMTAANKYVVK